MLRSQLVQESSKKYSSNNSNYNSMLSLMGKGATPFQSRITDERKKPLTGPLTDWSTVDS